MFYYIKVGRGLNNQVIKIVFLLFISVLLIDKIPKLKIPFAPLKSLKFAIVIQSIILNFNFYLYNEYSTTSIKLTLIKIRGLFVYLKCI